MKEKWGTFVFDVEGNMKRKAPSSTGRRTKPYAKKPSGKSLAAKVDGLLRTREKKFFDTTGSSAISTSGSVLLSSLALVQQGDGATNRDGRKINATYISLKGTWTLPEESPTTAPGSDVCRFIVYMDSQCNGAAATFTELFASADLLAHNNLNNSKRFKILCNDVAVLNVGALYGSGATWNEVNYYFEKFIRLDDVVIQYDASTGAITDLTANNFGVAAITENGKGVLNVNCRLRFVDA